MLIRVTPPHAIKSSEITDESVYRNRREFLREAGLLGVAAATVALPNVAEAMARLRPPVPLQGPGKVGAVTMGEELRKELTEWEDVTTYNNFYEFGTAKDDPAPNARNFKVKPWTVKVDGMVKKPADYQIEDFIKPNRVEDRIYRHRCVEGWSMVVPWRGFPMADFIKRVEPLPSAKYIEFTTLMDPKQMPGQRFPVLDWPYVEGLRMDEAMHPLTLFVTGVYGVDLPNQNGAPLRTVMPWKYGFKGCKSIVRVRFTDTEPRTAWNKAAPHEYGFYANVNPTVHHPRWSQAREQVIGSIRKKATLMFNGYEQVASLYSGMDLRKFY
jgi:methionine sulfoxide reductase catalytic subunit